MVLKMRRKDKDGGFLTQPATKAAAFRPLEVVALDGVSRAAAAAGVDNHWFPG